MIAARFPKLADSFSECRCLLEKLVDLRLNLGWLENLPQDFGSIDESSHLHRLQSLVGLKLNNPIQDILKRTNPDLDP